MAVAKTLAQKKAEALAKRAAVVEVKPAVENVEPVVEKKASVISAEDRRKRYKEKHKGGLNLKLSVDHHIEGYVLRFFNDTPGWIPQNLEKGWEHVKEKEVYDYTDSEEYVTRHAGTTEKGDGMKTYLLKIRKDWYEEDQKLTQTQNDKFDEAIKSGKLETPSNSYGVGAKIGHSSQY